MAGETKMIIITSNADIIRQFSSQKLQDTQIINLNSTEQTTSNSTMDNNIIDLAFLAELSQSNSIPKRTLDSSEESPTKSLKKSTNPLCVICDDHSIGYNYDVPTCASCKIFFRRNAFQNLENIRCLTGEHQCSVRYTVRRKCTRCRLERCFAMGMRKDFILTEEEKQRRKKRIDGHRHRTSESRSNLESTQQATDDMENANIHQTVEMPLNTLPVDDWITIESVRSLFISIFDNNNEQNSCIDVSNRIVALITGSQFIQQIALRFIDFYRQIDEFRNLDLDDRFTLIKNNLILVLPISKCFHYNSVDDCCSFGDNQAAVRHRRFYNLCGGSNEIRALIVNSILSLVHTTKQDPTILSLLSIILILSRSLSMDKDDSQLKDSLAVHRAQCYYIKVLWNYLVSQWGDDQACLYFLQLLSLIFRIQSMARIFADFFRLQYTTSNMIDQIAPIMQSVLHIS